MHQACYICSLFEDPVVTWGIYLPVDPENLQN